MSDQNAGSLPKQVHSSSILVVGVARDCADHLREDIDKLRASLSDFKQVHWLVVESDSDDGSVGVLDQLAREMPHFRYLTLGCLRGQIPQRTARLARCRNAYLHEIRQNPAYADVGYVAVADLDGCNPLLTPDAILSCWQRQGWDVCTANQQGPYFDIWALRHEEWSPNDCWRQHDFLRRYNNDADDVRYAAVHSRMVTIPPDHDWIEVDSAFGGFAIYRREVFTRGAYVGLTADGGSICEHVSFHRSLREQGCKIYINPQLINAAVNEHSKAVLRRARFFTQFKKLVRVLGRRLLSRERVS